MSLLYASPSSVRAHGAVLHAGVDEDARGSPARLQARGPRGSGSAAGRAPGRDHRPRRIARRTRARRSRLAPRLQERRERATRGRGLAQGLRRRARTNAYGQLPFEAEAKRRFERRSSARDPARARGSALRRPGHDLPSHGRALLPARDRKGVRGLARRRALAAVREVAPISPTRIAPRQACPWEAGSASR